MASKTISIRHARSTLGLDTEDEDVRGESIQNTQRSNKRKRSDLNGPDSRNGHGLTDGIDESGNPSKPRGRNWQRSREGTVEDSWTLSPPGTMRRERHSAASIPNGANGHQASATALSDNYKARHQPGSIVRVSMVNFVTYSAATFYPGPALNMVIGPNGTGKSSLVCAICLGLGWGPKHLGRAKDVGEFVKHDCSEGSIVIELKGRDGQPNCVIERRIKKKENKSTWAIDGHASNESRVLQHAKSLSIQIDNLCQFLPQDRVVEFAQLNPVQLLMETQRAAAPEHVTEWHDELKRLRAEEREAQVKQKSMRENLSNLEGRQHMQRADVERMRERTETLDKIEVLKSLRPFAVYYVARLKYDQILARKKEATDEVTRLKAEAAPRLKAINDKENYQRQIRRVIESRRALLDKMEGILGTLRTKHEREENNIKDHERERMAELKNDKARKGDIARLEGTISALQQQMAQAPIEFDPARYNEDSREKQRQIREIDGKVIEYQEARKERQRDIDQKLNQVRNAENALENLRSQAGQQTNKVRQISRDSATAWDWVQNNQERFEGRIYGPPIVECSVKDARYVNAIEALFQRNELLAFTCTNQRDSKMLNDQLYNTMKLSDISIRRVTDNLEHFSAPVDRVEMQRLGFEGWAIDYMSGPEPVLAMLCGEKNLHRTGVSIREHSDVEYAAIERSAVSSWVTSKSTYQITRRQEYGSGATSTRSREVNPAKFWTSQNIDVGAERDLRKTIAECKSDVEECKALNDRAGQNIQELKEQLKSLKSEKEELDDEKAQKQRALAEYNALPTKLEGAQAKLRGYCETSEKVRENLDIIKAKETESFLQKGQLSIDYGKTVEALFSMHKSLLAASIAMIEATSDCELLKEREQTVRRILQERHDELNEILRQYEGIKNDARNKIKALDKLPKSLRDYYRSLTNEEQSRTPEEVNLEIESQLARLELLHEGNPGAIKEYEERARTIERLQQKLADAEAGMSGLDQRIVELREKWEPALDALVRKISAAFSASFEKINCAGEVGIYKAGSGERPLQASSRENIDGEENTDKPAVDDNDFENWAIQIFVKFRENEKLQQLNSQRQSGGERAVSTIFYLMALQSLSRAPFRVVDEINQGMDPRNERVVHERMVDIACGNDGLGGNSSSEAVRERNAHPAESDDDETRGDDESRMTGQTSQYFLITPKLLSGLKYSPGMKVHCIASGEFMPTDAEELNFTDLIRRQRAVATAAA